LEKEEAHFCKHNHILATASQNGALFAEWGCIKVSNAYCIFVGRLHMKHGDLWMRIIAMLSYFSLDFLQVHMLLSIW